MVLRTSLGFLFGAGDAQLQAGLIVDFFCEGFRGDAIFLLMAELDEDPGGRPYAEAALLEADFLGLGDQLELIRFQVVFSWLIFSLLIWDAGSLGRDQGNEKQQSRKKEGVSFFHSHPWQNGRLNILAERAA